jgi:hypothetical protein
MDKKNLYVEKGLANVSDVFGLMAHVKKCEVCKVKFQEIITHSKEPKGLVSK